MRRPRGGVSPPDQLGAMSIATGHLVSARYGKVSQIGLCLLCSQTERLACKKTRQRHHMDHMEEPGTANRLGMHLKGHSMLPLAKPLFSLLSPIWRSGQVVTCTNCVFPCNAQSTGWPRSDIIYWAAVAKA